jgi:glycerophosphoryl diester phosphodiesterase
MTPPLVIAHRGASHLAPENTLAAFRLAWEQGADAIETDLRLTADGAIVCFHDDDGARLLGDSRRVREFTLDDLRALDAGAWKGPEWTGERVPTLAEALATVPAGKQIVLELKEDVVEPLARELAAAPRDRITLIAFDAEILARAKRALPDCRVLWLFGNYFGQRRLRGPTLGAWLADVAREHGLDGLDLRVSGRLNRHLVAPLLARELALFVYTVNGAVACRRCARLGLHGITTDRPADARRWLGISA